MFEEFGKNLLKEVIRVFGEKNLLEYRPAHGESFQIKGIFDDRYQEVEEGDLLFSSKNA